MREITSHRERKDEQDKVTTAAAQQERFPTPLRSGLERFPTLPAKFQRSTGRPPFARRGIASHKYTSNGGLKITSGIAEICLRRPFFGVLEITATMRNVL